MKQYCFTSVAVPASCVCSNCLWVAVSGACMASTFPAMASKSL